MITVLILLKIKSQTLTVFCPKIKFGNAKGVHVIRGMGINQAMKDNALAKIKRTKR
jgi:hypothetical protein